MHTTLSVHHPGAFLQFTSSQQAVLFLVGFVGGEEYSIYNNSELTN
jgi:hypothetical protein